MIAYEMLTELRQCGVELFVVRLRSGLPVFVFDEVKKLCGKTSAELQAIGMVKSTFPTSRELQ